MALSVTTIAALNQWVGQESALLPAAVPSAGVNGIPSQTLFQLGTQLNNGTVLADSIRNGYESFNLTNIPVPSASAATATMPLFIVPAAGNFAQVAFVVASQIGSVTQAANATSIQLKRINNANTASFGVTVSLGCGLTAGVPLIVPTGARNNLLVTTGIYSITASVMNITVNATNAGITWSYQPAIGDYLVVDSYNTSYTAAGANVGVFTINAVSSTYIYAAKASVYSTPCSSVAAITATANDVLTFATISQTSATYSAGDVLALQIVVPAGNVTSTQNIATTTCLLQLNLKPATF